MKLVKKESVELALISQESVEPKLVKDDQEKQHPSNSTSVNLSLDKQGTADSITGILGE
jgi:hypothetical protein